METSYNAIARFWIPGLFIILSIPLILKIVPPNVIYGVRTKKTLSDSKTWYTVNKYGGWYLFIAGVVLVVYRLFEPHFVVLQGKFKEVVFIVLAIALIALVIRIRKTNG